MIRTYGMVISRSALFAVLLCPALAHGAPTLSSSLKGEAKESYESGKLLLVDHDYAGAYLKFRAAYDASHDARLLWNMAACEKELRHYARASLLVERFLRDGATTVEPGQLEQARATLAALKSFFGPVTLKVQPEGAAVLVDGEPVGRAPFLAPVSMDLGRHLIRVERDGFAPAESRVEVTGQGAVTVEVALRALDDTARLAVRASDGRAVVTVDDRYAGSGPWEGALTPGRHRVKVTAPEKRPYVVDVQLARGERRSIDVTLESEKGGGALWPWLVGGGALVVAGGAAGAYFLFKPSATEGAPPVGKLGTVLTHSLRR